MTKTKIWVTIIGASLVAGLGTATSFYPSIGGVLAAASALVTAIVGYINGSDKI